jgi:aspartyl-tRNA(Asn)/glutamyl-tRNA(Gln) amidotransferase subunit B
VVKMTESTYRIQGGTGEWEVVIGLEVHAQITSESKLFSGASTEFGAEPNTQVSLVDAAMPGMLPTLNGECVRQAVRTGLAINAQINKYSRFDRKNYFYADLPQGYQISQLYHPIVGEGVIQISLDEKDPDAHGKAIGVERIHIEQDAGKLMHDQHPTMSYVDLNRCGVALMEIVSKPDMTSPKEAAAYVRKLRSILRYVGSCDGNMEQGSMRADVNVSVRKPGGELGTRTETKNVNSMRFIQAVIEYEAQRQVDLIEDGGTVVQETRLFDPDRNETRSMRSKEDAHDYRYFPDPDLLPLELEDDFIFDCKASLPELPDEKRARYKQVLDITAYNAAVLTAERVWAEYFENVLEEVIVKTAKPAKDVGNLVANFVINEVFGFLKNAGFEGGVDYITGEAISVLDANLAAELLVMLIDGELSRPLYKQVFEGIVGTKNSPRDYAAEHGLKQESDTGAIEKVIAEVMAANEDKVTQYRDGKDKLFGFFVGQTMKAMQGKANPQVVNELLKKLLG